MNTNVNITKVAHDITIILLEKILKELNYKLEFSQDYKLKFDSELVAKLYLDIYLKTLKDLQKQFNQ